MTTCYPTSATGTDGDNGNKSANEDVVFEQKWLEITGNVYKVGFSYHLGQCRKMTDYDEFEFRNNPYFMRIYGSLDSIRTYRQITV